MTIDDNQLKTSQQNCIGKIAFKIAWHLFQFTSIECFKTLMKSQEVLVALLQSMLLAAMLQSMLLSLLALLQSMLLAALLQSMLL
jgi:hypothetical protein